MKRLLKLSNSEKAERDIKYITESFSNERQVLEFGMAIAYLLKAIRYGNFGDDSVNAKETLDIYVEYLRENGIDIISCVKTAIEELIRYYNVEEDVAKLWREDLINEINKHI